MNFAVKFYSQIANPFGIPDAWIAEMNPLADDQSAPEGYTQMTQEEVDSYRNDHQSEYDYWHTNVWLPKVEAEQAEASRIDGVKRRSQWGSQVVEEFRSYAIRKNIGVSDSIDMMNALGMLLPYLNIGLLGPAAYILSTMTYPLLLEDYEDIYGEQDGITVKQQFLNRISEGNV